MQRGRTLLRGDATQRAAEKRLDARTQRRAAGVDLLVGPEQQQGTSQGDAIPETQSANLHDMAIDARAVGAFQVGENQIAGVLLHLGMVAAHALVIEPEEVALLAADCERNHQVAK